MFVQLKNKYGEKLVKGGTICEEDINVAPKLRHAEFTANGTYSAPDGFAGFGKITVKVANAGGGGSNGGECTGTHINIVDELPEVGAAGAYYGIRGFADAVIVQEGQAQSAKIVLSALGAGNLVLMQTTQEEFSNDMLSDGNTYLIYFTNIPDIYTNLWGSELAPIGMEFLGEIADMSQADTTKTGIYAVVGIKELYQCISGEYIRLQEDIPRVFAWSYSGSGDEVDYSVYTIMPKLQGEHIVIPSTYEGNPVTGISGSAFEGELFTSIEIPDSVTSIGDYAFEDCYGLKAITLPNNLTEINYRTFYNCVGFTDITIPDKVERICERSFRGCINLENIVIPSSVTRIEASAFEYCIALTNITFNGTIEQWNSVYLGAYWNKNVPATKIICFDGEAPMQTRFSFVIDIDAKSGGCYHMTYAASSGMTWEEWIVSGDNSSGFENINDGVWYAKNNAYVYNSDGARVNTSDVIIEGAEYNVPYVTNAT